MTTPYSDIFDLALMQIKDWKLDALYEVSVESFKTYLQGFLVLSIPEFETYSDQSLERDDESKTFSEDLTDKNKVMLSNILIVHWFEREINDIKQFKLHFGTKDFRILSEANNLRAKESYLVLKKEEINQDILDYAWHGQDFTDWIAYDFPTGA